MDRQEVEGMTRAKEYYPTTEEILAVMGDSVMTVRDIADVIGTRALKGIYESLCDAKEDGLVEIVWLDKYKSAWRARA